MAFVGVLPEREYLFQPRPRCDIAVSDAAAWRLNPRHRGIYDKLAIALGQGLDAAPCGVSPMALGLAADARVFVKPIINLAGMSLGAAVLQADQVSTRGGFFWSEYLLGEHVSSDCLLRDGELLMSVHTIASPDKDRERACWWRVGVDLPGQTELLRPWIATALPGYTGLCNVETIGGSVIEAHLRGSNGFFDLYGPDFVRLWVELVESGHWAGGCGIPGGMVASLFGEGELSPQATSIASRYQVDIRADRHSEDRIAVIRGGDAKQVLAARAELLAGSLATAAGL